MSSLAPAISKVFRRAVCRLFGHTRSRPQQVGLFYPGVALCEVRCDRCDRRWVFPVYPTRIEVVGADA